MSDKSDIISMHRADLVDAVTEAVKPLKARIDALEAELAAEKMQHSVTIADEHESRSAFQDRIAALEAELAACEGDRAQDQQRLFHIESALETKRAELAAELALRQTAEAYAARNALRVIEVESVLRSAHAELTDHGHQELPECECRIAHVLAGSQTETKRKCPECVYDVSNPFVCERCGTPMGPTVAETKGEQG